MWHMLDSDAQELLRKMEANNQVQFTPHASSTSFPSDSPHVGGYKFVPATPSPMPGRDGDDKHIGSSPFITWGTLESTPLALDPLDTLNPNHPLYALLPGKSSSSSTPGFKFPEKSEREKLAHKLADDLMKRQKSSTKSNHRSSPYNHPLSQYPGQRMLSPAAQQLAKKSKSLGLSSASDSQLRASYGASPRTPSRGSDKYNTTPKFKTPSTPQLLTPKLKNGEKIVTEQSDTKKLDSSLTDDLLNI